MKTILIALIFLVQNSVAYIRFMPTEQLVKSSEYIVVASMQSVYNTGRKQRWRGAEAHIVENKLIVIESLKGTMPAKKTFVLNTLKFDEWMEDNVKLPSQGKEILLFLKRDKKNELKPVNGIQGVWRMRNGEPSGIGSGKTLQQIRDMVQKQVNSCKSKSFASLVDIADMQTQAGHYKEAYRKAYAICPMKDLEDQMAWLMGKVGD